MKTLNKLFKFFRSNLWRRILYTLVSLFGIAVIVIGNYLEPQIISGWFYYFFLTIFIGFWFFTFFGTYTKKYKDLKSYITLDRLKKLSNSMDYLRHGLTEPIKITKTVEDDYIEELTDLTYELVNINKRREEIIQYIEKYEIEEN